MTDSTLRSMAAFFVTGVLLLSLGTATAGDEGREHHTLEEKRQILQAVWNKNTPYDPASVEVTSHLCPFMTIDDLESVELQIRGAHKVYGIFEDGPLKGTWSVVFRSSIGAFGDKRLWFYIHPIDQSDCRAFVGTVFL